MVLVHLLLSNPLLPQVPIPSVLLNLPLVDSDLLVAPLLLQLLAPLVPLLRLLLRRLLLSVGLVLNQLLLLLQILPLLVKHQLLLRKLHLLDNPQLAYLVPNHRLQPRPHQLHQLLNQLGSVSERQRLVPQLLLQLLRLHWLEVRPQFPLH